MTLKHTERATPRRKFRLGQIVTARDMDGGIVRAKVVERPFMKGYGLARVIGSDELIILSPINLAVGEAARAA